MTRHPIRSASELAAYLAHNAIECLECGRRCALLGPHLRVAHQMAVEDYRAAWGIPAGTALAGRDLRDRRRVILEESVAAGLIVRSPADASDAAGGGPRGTRVAWERADQAARAARNRPGDWARLPPGAKRANGRDADLARTAQQRRRAGNEGNSG